EADGELVVDLVAYDDDTIVSSLYLSELRSPGLDVPNVELRRYHLPLGGGRASSETIAEGFELPRINYRRCNGRPYRYVYGTGASLAVDAGQPVAGELGGDRGSHLLAALEGDVHVERAELDHLAPQGPQPDVDPEVLVVPERDVLERLGVEVGPELAVEDGENVLVESGGDARGVVVGRFERGPILHEIGAEQEPVVGAEQVRDPSQEAGALRG